MGIFNTAYLKENYSVMEIAPYESIDEMYGDIFTLKDIVYECGSVDMVLTEGFADTVKKFVEKIVETVKKWITKIREIFGKIGSWLLSKVTSVKKRADDITGKNTYTIEDYDWLKFLKSHISYSNIENYFMKSLIRDVNTKEKGIAIYSEKYKNIVHQSVSEYTILPSKSVDDILRGPEKITITITPEITSDIVSNQGSYFRTLESTCKAINRFSIQALQKWVGEFESQYKKFEANAARSGLENNPDINNAKEELMSIGQYNQAALNFNTTILVSYASCIKGVVSFMDKIVYKASAGEKEEK